MTKLVGVDRFTPLRWSSACETFRNFYLSWSVTRFYLAVFRYTDAQIHSESRRADLLVTRVGLLSQAHLRPR